MTQRVEVVTFDRMTDEERDFLVREATERGIRLSEYIRRALLLNMPPVDKINA